MSTAAITAPPRLSPFLDPYHHLFCLISLACYQRRLARPTTRSARVCARGACNPCRSGVSKYWCNVTLMKHRERVGDWSIPAGLEGKATLSLFFATLSTQRSVFRIARLTVPLTFLLLVSLIYFHSNNQIISSVESCENLSFVPGRYCRTKRDEEYIQRKPLRFYPIK